MHLVTLTITEKGYTPAAARLYAARLLADALSVRRARGLGAFTAISCDNLPANGERLRGAVLVASAPGLAEGIDANAAFPSTMVDRMVPAADEDDLAQLSARIGVQDRAAIKTKPFRQWVIEDRFAGQHPDWESLGVQLTRDVTPWEDAKLRLLNGAHSAIAYLGALAGIDYVDQFVAIEAARRYVETLMEEAAATLSPRPGSTSTSIAQR